MFVLRLDEFSQLTYGLYMFLTQFCGLIKFICFYWRNVEFRQFIHRVNSFVVKNDFEEALIARRIEFFFKVTVFYYIMAMIAIHTTELMAIFSETVQLPFSAWYPWLNWQNDVRDYWLAILYQYVAVTSASLLIITIDVYFSFLIFVVSIQLEIIGHRLQQIGSAVQQMNSIRMCDAQQLNRGETKQLTKCLELYIEAVDLKVNVEDCFSLPFFFQITASGIVISSIVNEVAQVNERIFYLLIRIINEYLEFNSNKRAPIWQCHTHLPPSLY